MDQDSFFHAAQAVSLDQMLQARELRAAKQKEFLRQSSGALVCFTMNIPGAFKSYPLAEYAFDEGVSALKAQLRAEGVAILAEQSEKAVTGYTLWLVPDAPADRIKRLTVEIEEEHPLGRLFDMDVLASNGEALKGEDYGRSQRTCLICGGPVWECSRSRRHSAEELAMRTAEIIAREEQSQYARTVSEIAVKSLLYEVSATPKPGLVDRVSRGAHTDMDFSTFLDSSSALIPYFCRITRKGLLFQGEPHRFLPALRYLGRQGEDAMFAATKGVNTHKGLIFSLGLLCACMGYLHARSMPETVDSLLDLCAAVAREAPKELDQAAHSPTHGQQAYRRSRMTGIRGEAAAGYPHVRIHGYPVLADLVKRGYSLNDAGVVALLHLIAHVDDTNIMARSGPETLREIQQRVSGELLRRPSPEDQITLAGELDDWMTRRGISPGGSADLLALSYFMYFLFDG